MQPQLENGYTKIANEIFDNLSKIRIPGESGQVLAVIFRKTYGFHKKKDRISLSQFCVGTGLKKPNVCRAINKLLSMQLIIKIDTNLGEVYEFQKDHKKWVPLSKRITGKSLSKKIMSVIQKDNASLSKKIHTKDTTTKDTYTKDNSNAVALRGDTGIITVIDLFKEVNKACADFYGNKTQRKFAQKLVDTYGQEKVDRVITALPTLNRKLYNKATTPKELWDKWAKIEAEAQGLKEKRGNYSPTKIY